MDRTILKRECKFSFYLPAVPGVREDTHIVKEILHYSDGILEPNLKVLSNFKRPFWITKPHFQNHKQKKESEDIDKLNMYYSTQSKLGNSVASRLGSRYMGKRSMWDVVDSPYLYGTDVNSQTILKHMYMKKYPDAISPYSITVLDTEVDTDTNELIVVSIASASNIYTAILNKFIPNKRDLDKQLKHLYDKHIPKTEISNKIVPTFELFDTEIDILQAVFKVAHSWKTDFITAWNMEYDINVILGICKKYDYDPKYLFCEPSLPEELKSFEFKVGQKSKLTESGVFKPTSPEEQWHVVRAPAHFYWIDAMSAHRYIRVGGKSVPGGYSLNNILKVELGKDFAKLKFDDENTTNKVGIDWHKYMVANKPLEYIIYNNWDSMSILHLDDKTKDLSYNLFVLAGVSSFEIFNSGPKRLVDALHFFYIENNKVLGVKPREVNGDKILGLDNWISILSSSRVRDNSIDCIVENPNSVTNIRAFLYDSDQAAGYPNDTIISNASRDTTTREILDINGIDKDDFKSQNINIMFGKVNSVDYCNRMYNYPTYQELIKKII